MEFEDPIMLWANQTLNVFGRPLVNASTSFSSVVWNYNHLQGPDEPEGGSAGVREPRRPPPAPPTMQVAIPL